MLYRSTENYCHFLLYLIKVSSQAEIPYKHVRNVYLCESFFVYLSKLTYPCGQNKRETYTCPVLGDKGGAGSGF